MGQIDLDNNLSLGHLFWARHCARHFVCMFFNPVRQGQLFPFSDKETGSEVRTDFLKKLQN